MTFQPNLLLRSLVEHGVAFVMVGGMAAVVHGASVVTADLDVCYESTPENRRRLVAALAPLKPYLREVPPGLPFFWDERTVRDAPVLTLMTDAGAFDMLAEVAGVGPFEAVRAASSRFEVAGLPVHILNLDALIAAKRAAGRPKDLVVLPELEALLTLRNRG